MQLSNFVKKFVTINSAAMLLSAAAVPALQPQLIEPSTVHAASTDDLGVSTWNDWGTVKWGIDSNGTLWIKPQSGSTGTLESLEHNSLEQSPWYNSRSSIKSVKLEGTIIAASGCYGLFQDLTNCTDMDLASLDTSKVTDMNYMFSGCSSLANLDVSKWDTSAVAYMDSMFNGCSSLANLDVSKWNTSVVKDMYAMFQSCRALTSIPVGNWKTSKVTNMGSMFNGCSSLADLDVSKWDTSAVQDMDAMFNGCSSLANLDVSKWNTSAVTNMYAMFQSCKALTSIPVSDWDTSKATGMDFMFNGCSSLANLDVSKWNTSAVTNMYAMFQSCRALTSIPVGNWKTSKVTNMGSMFNGCSSLANLDVSKWNTSAAQDMDAMFNGCSSLANLDVSKWNTSVVKDMYAMFQSCKALTSIPVSDWDTSKATGMDFMFNGCSSLVNLDVSKWNTSAVTNMYAMFYRCYKLSELKLGKGFKISSGQDTRLSNPTRTSEYTGHWSKADGSNGMSASEMMGLTGEEHDASGKSLNKTLDAADRAGTWVWERGYTVTVDPNGGSGTAKTYVGALSKDQTYGTDSVGIYIEDPGYTRKAYESTGAADAKDGSGNQYQYPFTLQTSSDKTIYAQWKFNGLKIAYHANGGKGTMSDTILAKGDTTTLTSNSFTRTGFTFNSWNTKPDGKGTEYANQQEVSDLSTSGQTITLYAQWRKADWNSSGDDITKTKDDGDRDVTHDAGTYILTIPTKISKKSMPVGNIDDSVSYDVNVTGNIPEGNYVHVSVAASGLMGNSGSLDLAVKQGKKIWNEEDAYGTVNPDGSLSGSTASDTVKITGTSKSIDQYSGLVTYTAVMNNSGKDPISSKTSWGSFSISSQDKKALETYEDSGQLGFTAGTTLHSDLTGTSYQWSINGVNISGANQADYLVTDADLKAGEENGKFQSNKLECTVTKADGTKETAYVYLAVPLTYSSAINVDLRRTLTDNGNIAYEGYTTSDGKDAPKSINCGWKVPATAVSLRQ